MLTLKKAQDEFVKYLRENGRANATVIAYAKDIDQLVSFLAEKKGRTKPAEVKTDDIVEFMKSLDEQNYTPKSVSRKTNSAKTFFRFLTDRKEVKEDPATLVAHPKFDVKPPRILSKIEYRALRDACKNDIRTNAVVELLLQTGIRIGELANLRTSDLHPEKSELYIRAMESHPERTIPFNVPAQKALKAYLDIRPQSKDDHVFITKSGHQFLVRNIRTTLDRFFKKAGLTAVKVNDLRHTFVAFHLRNGVPLNLISRIVGHKRLSTTEHYLNYVEQPKEQVKGLEEL
ncbi:hypothetical protein COY33_01415 [candidate division WWE3 bacterium CG_4_10_14_0_2_um_filter_42_7]|uniref:Tyrosine recombinase XerC n=2 Tax=Katanobacteria TaxID=422282 RepID=A0A2H0X929_UNCKA|nr:MAG: hypothetical protein COT51_03205 [candidate division WWE3 bacterium CG08_land_8_20_14_0_20_41_15]PIZ43520.1 MAG: hypothetical protein COY33_01415 [candidate division WWE3 bacterium CG_4_10_14_0_2_um_filter_42_7]